MKNCLIVILVTLILGLTACGKAEQTPTPNGTPTETPPNIMEPEVPPELAYLGVNPVEKSQPIYGNAITVSVSYPRDFDGHQKAGYGPSTQLPCFNQLVMFDLTYIGISPKSIIGDLAETWEMGTDGTEITFKLRQGVKWHDGIAFTADDVVYSLDKMTDPDRSVVSGNYPAYQSVEKIDDYTVKVHLKYPSAGFMMALAGPYSQIQSKHLAGTDSQSINFLVGTGPFIVTEVTPQVSTKWKRNPDYFKKDKYGNQLPYLNVLNLVDTGSSGDDIFISRRLDVRNLVVSASSIDTFETLKDGAPEALWQKTVKTTESVAFFINTTKKPFDDIRVRQALGLVLNQEDIIIGYSGDADFGIPGAGLLQPSMGLPPEDIANLMGWNQPFEDRVKEAKRLLAEAGVPDDFTLEIMAQKASGAPTVGHPGASLVLAESFRQNLNIEASVLSLQRTELEKKIADSSYQIYCQTFIISDDPAQLGTYLGSSSASNWSNYANPQLDTLTSNLDRIIDPAQRQQNIWSIERILITDLPALPTGIFPTRHMFYYPHVKNLRFQTQPYSNICRLEDVWIDPSLKPAGFGTE